MILEVIATTLADAIHADQYGVDRIELITGMQEGGLTPSIGLIEEVVHAVRIPVYVMVRPHSRSFFYDGLDVQTMVADIRKIKATGARGIVMGALTSERTIDREVMKRLLHEASGLSVTFHRAFDEVRDQSEAMYTLLEMGQIERVLTSGGKPNVLNAVAEIVQLLDLTRDSHLDVMAGSGLTVDGLATFLKETGVEEVHFGRGVRKDENANLPIDRDMVNRIRRIAEDVATTEC